MKIWEHIDGHVVLSEQYVLLVKDAMHEYFVKRSEQSRQTMSGYISVVQLAEDIVSNPRLCQQFSPYSTESRNRRMFFGMLRHGITQIGGEQWSNQAYYISPGVL